MLALELKLFISVYCTPLTSFVNIINKLFDFIVVMVYHSLRIKKLIFLNRFLVYRDVSI